MFNLALSVPIHTMSKLVQPRQKHTLRSLLR